MSHCDPAHTDLPRLAFVPELPEVEALVQDLRGRLVGRAISRVDLAAFSALKTFDPPLHALHGTLVEDVTRHGKFLDIDASGVHLVIHLARAGWIRWRDEVPALPARPNSKNPLAARVVIDDPDLDTQPGLDITEAGTRKGLAIYVVRDPQQVEGIARLGPDPLSDDFTIEVLRGILEAEGRKQIKGVMRMQSIIAGIGNAYSDEILHAARMSPFHPASMPADDVHRLYEALQQVLGEAVERARGVTASSLKAEKRQGLRVHGRKGEACPVCGDTVRQVIYADSTFEYCATCQTGGKPLADRVLSRLGVRR